ncbi:uncharacterized protein LOC106666232 [Cimex lectularius]|uniref:Uncharacterized protein n=1 Tax=Cimex lectularius TaxID=79782 RepID=A0A8I6TE66_CIMLE|nr:uncharacterized protein LOC106666232 [Cimex lectularius]
MAQESKESIDTLYSRYINMSNLLVPYLSHSDKYLARKWIIFGSKLPRESGTAPGENRFRFAKHLFQVIKDEVYATFLESNVGKSLTPDEKNNLWEELQNLGQTDDFVVKSLSRLHEKKQGAYMSMWSPDKKTYIAAKPIPGKGALVYLAVAENPDQGWDMPTSKID